MVPEAQSFVWLVVKWGAMSKPKIGYLGGGWSSGLWNYDGGGKRGEWGGGLLISADLEE